jgi:hypothetical protein
MYLDLLERVLVSRNRNEMFPSWCCIHSQLTLPGDRLKYASRRRPHAPVKYYMKLQGITSTLNIYIPLSLEVCIMFWAVFSTKCQYFLTQDVLV